MKRAVLAMLLVGAAACVAPQVVADTPVAAPNEGPSLGRTIEARVVGAAGRDVGGVKLTQGVHGVLIRIALAPGALTPGWHGAHLHENADCSDTTAGYRASGAHVGHGAMAQHGLLHPLGPEAGDLPNIHAAADGSANAEFFSTGVALHETARGGLAPLLGPKGAALVIHESADDHATQPIGGAGARVACAAIRRAGGQIPR